MDVSIASFGDKQSSDYLSKHFLLSDTRRDLLFFTPNYPILIHDVVFGICVQGRGGLSVNLMDYVLEENDVIVLLSGSILEYRDERISEDFLLKFVSFSMDFVQSLEFPELFTGVKQQPVVRLTAVEANRVLEIYGDLEEKSNRQLSPYKTEIVRHSLLAGIYEFYQVFEERVPRGAELGKDMAFQMVFFDLLYANYRTQHHLHFYAERLFITPKYLSAKIKTLTNRSANDWINEFLILEAKSLLKSTNKTVKEIAYTLGFPDASTFGKFFRKVVGVTPKGYREEVI